MATQRELLEHGREIVQAMLDTWAGAGWAPNSDMAEKGEAWLVDSLLGDPDPLPVFTDPTPDRPSLVYRLEFAGGAIQVAVMMPQDHAITRLDLDLANNGSGGEQKTRLKYEPDYQVVSHG